MSLIGQYGNGLCPKYRIKHMKLAPYQNYYIFTNTYNYDKGDEYDRREVSTRESKYIFLTIPERPPTLVADIHQWMNSDEVKSVNAKLEINKYTNDMCVTGPYRIVD